MSHIHCDLIDCDHNLKGKCHANRVRLADDGDVFIRCKTYKNTPAVVYSPKELEQLRKKETENLHAAVRATMNRLMEFQRLQHEQSTDLTDAGVERR